MRIKEYEHLRDLVKKLIYSLEQLNIQNIDFKNAVASNSGEGGLPELSNITSSKPEVNPILPGVEVMMVKRLNYLRKSLDVHDP